MAASTAPVVLSVGSINADFLVRVPQPPTGPGTMSGHDLLRTSGGKGANVAVLAHRLGTEARLLGCVGDDDLADQALRGPRDLGVDLSGVHHVAGATGVAWIAVPPGGDKTIVLTLNANDGWAQHADALADTVAAAPAGSVLVVDLEVPVECARAATSAAGRQGFPVVLDPAPPGRVPADVLAGADHVLPDHREAEALTGVDASTPHGARRAAEALRRRGVRAACVKLSSGGCVVSSPTVSGVVEAPEVEVVDATGAGDAFAGAFAHALTTGADLLDAAALGVAASSCAVGGYGSQESYPSSRELTAMRARM